MLPRVRINYANGTLGQVAAMADGCLGMMALGAKEVTGDDKFKLGKAYTLRKLADLEALGVTSENNPNLYRNVKEFYAEAGDGTELWLTGYAESETFANAFDKDNAAGAVALLKASNGKIRGLVAFKTPAEAYELTTTEGLDADVFAALPKAQQLGDWATDTLRAPIFSLVEGYGYAGDPAALKDLTETEYNRAGVVLGDTAASSKNAAMGVVAGRIAASAVQRKISRVRDGALRPLTFYVGAEPAELADLETINDKGYITFRTFVGKAGYFITDDNLATTPEDDYRALTNRRVIDKAYRIAYAQLVEWLNDEVPVSKSGTLVPAWCSTVEADVEQAIETQMTAQGNLGNDPSDSSDTGVECKIDYDQNILATSQVKIGLRVKPNGYAKYIDVELGFKTA